MYIVKDFKDNTTEGKCLQFCINRPAGPTIFIISVVLQAENFF